MDGVSAPSERSESAAPAHSTLRNQVAVRGPPPVRVAWGGILECGLCRDLQAHHTLGCGVGEHSGNAHPQPGSCPRRAAHSQWLRRPMAPDPQQTGLPGAGRPHPHPPLPPAPALRGPDSPSCVSTEALSFMEFWAGAEPSVLPPRPQPRPCHRLGAPSRGRRASGAEPGAERGGGAGGGARSGAAAAGSAADPVLWLCTAMHSTAW